MATKADKYLALIQLVDKIEKDMKVIVVYQGILTAGLRDIIRDELPGLIKDMMKREIKPGEKTVRVDPNDPVPSDVDILKALGIKEDPK